jgi:TPR repeat protein
MALKAALARYAAPLALAVAVVAAPADAAEKRVALVIGEGAYRFVPTLANPPNDARDVAQMLRTLGFDVTLRTDVDQAGMKQALQEFGARAGHADLALFYYGGHGMQYLQHNYLVPVDASLRTVADISQRTVSLDDVKAALALSPQSLIFLDACRESPLKNDGAAPQGLARVGATNAMIAYATQPNTVAFDGAGRNSPYAQALLQNLTSGGQDIANMMISVHKDVMAATGSAQAPMEETSLTRQIFLAGEGPADASPEAQLWRVAKRERAPELLQLYLRNYPSGPHAEDAKGLLASAAPSAGKGPDKPGDRDTEEKDWQLALKTPDPAATEFYLRQYAQGAHAHEAEERLRRLKEAQTSAQAPGERCDLLAANPRDGTASAPGVDISTLAKNAREAIDACEKAHAASPKVAHYQALLARAHYAAGDYDEAVKLYRAAAEADDARALWSLGHLMETGDHVAKDVKGAYALYEKAAARGNADAAIDVAVALKDGRILPKDVKRAYALLKSAADSGSAIATFNLGLFADQGWGGNAADALNLYHLAAQRGYPEAHRAAAVLLDEGQHTAKNPEAAAEDLLKAVTADSGKSTAELTGATQYWAPATVSALQRRLKQAGYYAGAIDGRSGPGLAPALKRWRLLGDPRGIVAQSTK